MNYSRLTLIAGCLQILVLVLICCLCSCNKHESYPEVQIFGHAGMGMDTPYSVYHDNSEEAIDLALSFPTIDGVEMDIRMSKDGTLWLFHESRLEITTNGIGCLSEFTDTEIEQLHYKSIHQEKLVRLNTILEKLKKGHTFILDIKHWSDCAQAYFDPQRFKDSLLAIPEELKDQIIIDTSYPHWLFELSKDYRVLFSAISYEEGMKKLQEIEGLYGVMLRSKDMTADQIAEVKALGKAVFLCEMRSSKMQRVAIKKSPTAILADDPRGALVIRD